MVFNWNEAHRCHDAVYNDDRYAREGNNLGDELLAGGAACAGFKAFEDHQRREGRPMSHGVAKSLLAGFAAAEVDRIARKRGEGWFDKEKAKHRAKKNAEQLYDEHYIQRNGADQYDPVQTNQPQILERIDVL